MSAEEALKYGLIDEIVQPNDEKIKALSLPPPGQAPQLFGELPDGASEYEFGKLVRLAIFFLITFIMLSLSRFCTFSLSFRLYVSLLCSLIMCFLFW